MFGLFGWVLWHINLCRLFHAKSILMPIVIFQKIQFSMSTQFTCQKRFYFKPFSLFKQFLFQIIQFSMSRQFVKTVLIQPIHFSISTDVYTQLNVKTVLYQTIRFCVSSVSMLKTVTFQPIQFSISMQFKCKYSLIVKNISVSSYSVLSNSSNSNNSV